MADFPAVPDYQSCLGCTYHELAILRRDEGQLAEARQLLSQAIMRHRAALESDPQHPTSGQSLRAGLEALAQILVRLEEHGEAARTAEELARVLPAHSHDSYDAASSINLCYNAACSMALCVPLAEKDTKLAEAKRKELAQRYADRAMELLRDAVRRGWNDAGHTKKDSDLNPLRSRDDFEQLLAELEAKQKK